MVVEAPPPPPRLTAATGARSCWPSSSPGASPGGCWSSPSPRSCPEPCVTEGEGKRGRGDEGTETKGSRVTYGFQQMFLVTPRCYLSLKLPLLGFQLIFYFLGVVRRRFVPGDLAFESANLEGGKKSSGIWRRNLVVAFYFFFVVFVLKRSSV